MVLQHFTQSMYVASGAEQKQWKAVENFTDCVNFLE